MENASGAHVRRNREPFDRNRLVPVRFDIFFRPSNLGWRNAPRPAIEEAAVVVAGAAKKRDVDRLFQFR